VRRESPGQTVRAGLTLGLAVFLAASVGFMTLGLVWAHDLRSPRITLLGGGEDTLSVYITAGSARLLIATGNDPAQLTTALERARYPTARRLDLALLTGDGRDLRGPAAIATDLEARYLATIGYLPPSPETDVIRAAGAVALTTSKRMTLADGVTLDLEVAPQLDGEETKWRALVRHGPTTVAILSDGSAAELFTWPGSVSALVVTAGTEPLSAWDALPAPLLAFPDEAISGPDLRAAAATGAAPGWAVRVFPGEAIRLQLEPDGLELGPGAGIPLASPVTGRRREPHAAGRARTRLGSRPAAPDQREYQRRSGPSPWRRAACSGTPAPSSRPRRPRASARCKSDP
jgi:hypothetical protein